MSKNFRKYAQIRKMESIRSFKLFTAKMVKNEVITSDDVFTVNDTHPTVDNSELTVDNKISIDQLLIKLSKHCLELSNTVDGIDDFDLITINKHVHVVKSLCQLVIAKIETKW